MQWRGQELLKLKAFLQEQTFLQLCSKGSVSLLGGSDVSFRSPLLQCEEQLSCSCGLGLCFAKQSAVIELRTCRELTDEGWGWEAADGYTGKETV